MYSIYEITHKTVNIFLVQFISKTKDVKTIKQSAFIFSVYYLQVDESQHRGYAELCDKRRYHEIAHDVYSSSGERPIVFLRFNPDGYVDSSNTRITTPWKQLKSGLWSIGKDRIIEFLDRLDILTQRIEYYLDEDNIPSAPLIVETMFYDNHNPDSPVVSLSLDGRI